VTAMAKRKSKSAPKSDIVALFDVHVPDHDEAAFNAALSFIADRKPSEIILGGDFLELASCSQHGGDPSPPSFLDDIIAGRRALDAIARASPKSKITYMAGNHEDRLRRYVVSQASRLHGAVSLPDALGLHERGISWVPYGHAVARGKLLFLHGTFETRYHAARHLEAYGHSVAYGHTHRPQTYSRATATSPLQAAFGVGCLRSLDPSWLHGVPCGWAHGLLYVEFYGEHGHYTAHNIVMADRKFAFGGRVYG
jgi:predicted phosphodiesterase